MKIEKYKFKFQKYHYKVYILNNVMIIDDYHITDDKVKLKRISLKKLEMIGINSFKVIKVIKMYYNVKDNTNGSWNIDNTLLNKQSLRNIYQDWCFNKQFEEKIKG